VRGREVLRILPRLNEAVNEEWISDKTRFVWDGLRTQRLDRPYLRDGGRLRPASWSEAFAAVARKVRGVDGRRIGAIGGDLAAVEDLYALKQLLLALGSPNLDIRQDGAALDPARGRASYLFNPTIAGIEQADAILIVGANPRYEASVLNARIRKRWRAGGVRIGLVGAPADLTYPCDYLGAGSETLADLAAGKGTFGEILAKAKRPLVVVGQAALKGGDGAAVLAAAASIATAEGRDEGWNGLAVLHNAASRVGGLDIGFVPAAGGLDTAGMIGAAGSGALDVLFLLGADEIDTAKLGSAFVVYIGSHGDAGAHRADVILPAAAYTEKSGTYVNTEGRVQLANRAAFPPGEAREDWAVLRALSDVLGKRLPFDSLGELRRALYAAHPHLAAVDAIAKGTLDDVRALAGAAPSLGRSTFGSPVADFYLTNPIARASATMAECSTLAAGLVAAAAE
jgi:NADH-quinone oxidoreductase subunit G